MNKINQERKANGHDDLDLGHVGRYGIHSGWIIASSFILWCLKKRFSSPHFDLVKAPYSYKYPIKDSVPPISLGALKAYTLYNVEFYGILSN